MNWKYFYASVKGTSHITNGTKKQDNCKVCELNIKECTYLVCAVADGAGSAKYSDLSSNFICKLFVKKTKKWLENSFLEDLTRDIIAEWFVHFQNVIKRAVQIYKLESVRDFATTLLFSILNKNSNIFIQIGDGIIAIDNKDSLEAVFIPQNGEYLNTTRFATESDAINIFMFKRISEPIKRMAMHTDGIEQIAFDYREKQPFESFFVPFYGAMKKSDKTGCLETLSKQLELFLESDRVNKKTDDDKTLVLALSTDIENISIQEEIHNECE